MEKRAGKEGRRRRKDKANSQYSGTVDHRDVEVMVVDDEEEDEVKVLEEEVKLVKETPAVVPDRAQRRLARDGVGRTELLVVGLPPTISEAEVWMTVSMGPRDGPRPSRVEVMGDVGEASALLGFKSSQYAERFRTLYLKGFLGGCIKVDGHVQKLESEVQPQEKYF